MIGWGFAVVYDVCNKAGVKEFTQISSFSFQLAEV